MDDTSSSSSLSLQDDSSSESHSLSYSLISDSDSFEELVSNGELSEPELSWALEGVSASCTMTPKALDADAAERVERVVSRRRFAGGSAPSGLS